MKKKEKKCISEALNPFYMILVSGQTTKSQTTSKDEAVIETAIGF